MDGRDLFINQNTTNHITYKRLNPNPTYRLLLLIYKNNPVKIDYNELYRDNHSELIRKIIE